MNVRARRAGIVFLCVLSFVVCVGLAWWQWQRFLERGGDWQNFGYALLWPLFGLFPTFMVWRMRKLRAQAPEPERAVSHPTPPAEPDKPVKRQYVTRVDEDDDPELAAYNRYLAQLNALDQQETR